MKYRELLEKEDWNLEEIKNEIQKIVKEVTKQKHEFYVEDNHISTGDRVEGYDFGPQIFIEKNRLVFWDELDSGITEEYFFKVKDLYKFTKEELIKSKEI